MAVQGLDESVPEATLTWQLRPWPIWWSHGGQPTWTIWASAHRSSVPLWPFRSRAPSSLQVGSQMLSYRMPKRTKWITGRTSSNLRPPATISSRPFPWAKALLPGSLRRQLPKRSSRNQSTHLSLQRILAPRGGRFCSFLASLQARRRRACRLRVTLASCNRWHLRPSDNQRGHPVRVLGETPSCRVPDTLFQKEYQKGSRAMPPWSARRP